MNSELFQIEGKSAVQVALFSCAASRAGKEIMKALYIACAALALIAALVFSRHPRPEPVTAAPPPQIDIADALAPALYIQLQVHCLRDPLSASQMRYLETASAHATQRYLRAFTRPECETLALAECEKLYPGRCIAR